MVKNKLWHTDGLRPRPNANDGGLHPLWAALSRQSVSPKFDIVFFPNRRRNAERIAPLHRQTKSLLQPKGLSTLSCCFSNTSTDLRYKRCCRLSIHTCCLYCDGLKPEASPKRPVLPALSLLGLPRWVPYWYGRAINVGIAIGVYAGGIPA